MTKTSLNICGQIYPAKCNARNRPIFLDLKCPLQNSTTTHSKQPYILLWLRDVLVMEGEEKGPMREYEKAKCKRDKNALICVSIQAVFICICYGQTFFEFSRSTILYSAIFFLSFCKWLGLIPSEALFVLLPLPKHVSATLQCLAALDISW